MLGFRGTGDATFCRCRIWLEYKPRTRSAQSIAGWDWGDGDRGCGHVINLLAPDSITFAELILLNSHSTRFGQKHPLPLSKGSELTHHPVSTLHTFRCMESMGDSWRTSHTLGRFPLSHGLPYHHCRGSKSSFTSDFPHFPKTLLKKTDQFYSDTMPAKQSKASNRTVSYFWRPQLVEFTQREQRRLVTPGHCMPFNWLGHQKLARIHTIGPCDLLLMVFFQTWQWNSTGSVERKPRMEQEFSSSDREISTSTDQQAILQPGDRWLQSPKQRRPRARWCPASNGHHPYTEIPNYLRGSNMDNMYIYISNIMHMIKNIYIIIIYIYICQWSIIHHITSYYILITSR